MRLSVITTAAVAAVVGFGGTIAVVLEAAARVGASPAETSSWVAAICLAQAVAGLVLTLWHRIPIIIAWSTPGAALIAASQAGIGMANAAGAFLLCGALIVVTAFVRPLGRLIEKIPAPLAAALLAGVLLRFVLAAFTSAEALPALVLPILAVFLIGRLLTPTLAAIEALIAGFGLAILLGMAKPVAVTPALSTIVLVTPAFDASVLIGLALPLYLVTMASQNLPGFAVLRSQGYPVPATSILATTGLGSILSAFIGGHTTNLGAIVAALCTGPDTHPDKDMRWPAGIVFALCFALFAAIGGMVIEVIAAMPAELVTAVAGLALISPLMGAVTGAVADEPLRFPALLTLAITASGLSFFSIGAPFWGLLAGLLVLGLDRMARRA